MSDEAPPVLEIEGSRAPDIFADEALGWALAENIVRIAFASHVVTVHDEKIQTVRRVSGHLTLTPHATLGLFKFLKTIVAAYEQRGVLKRVSEGPENIQ